MSIASLFMSFIALFGAGQSDKLPAAVQELLRGLPPEMSFVRDFHFEKSEVMEIRTYDAKRNPPAIVARYDRYYFTSKDDFDVTLRKFRDTLTIKRGWSLVEPGGGNVRGMRARRKLKNGTVDYIVDLYSAWVTEQSRLFIYDESKPLDP